MRRAFHPKVIEGDAQETASCIDDDAGNVRDADPCALKPSAFYFRRDIRATDNPEILRSIAIAIVAEHERLRAWCQEQGLHPPKWMVAPSEAQEKGWSA